jgi:hypothetical protein
MPEICGPKNWLMIVVFEAKTFKSREIQVCDGQLENILYMSLSS